ncbi:type IV toxin-antitoxin system AbiEi family antitoxin domain-containing protein [Pseudomonas asplenii]|uniref:type IV toxin-antitoxin system AbiEi family antitoxin domain-containing protein n=1 Tax=Pseudomonas asplenii TaxID=53407 RepID=UPI0022341B7B|nr:type IV toxin-antitoxin system AbiEi family antitoxin domain-containing protein [Pseudomonas asplenii]UZE28468.1 type IV toxin-antitoxin system AbiEi family antitoxin domain-containing protein [Pseudomonas asplenii]
MKNAHQQILDLAARNGLIRSRDAVVQGLPRVALTRLVRQGLLQRISHGLYALPQHEIFRARCTGRGGQQMPGRSNLPAFLP